ncbi:MAG: hypothetical protein IJ944_04485 [Clostridia bacterium]|nr:hypothetical protein [Clostridia bacterium]
MKKMKKLLAIVLCLTLVVTIVPFAFADDSAETIGESRVPPENVYNIPENLEITSYYANRLQVTIRGTEHPQRKLYTVEDFPEISEYLVSIDAHKIYELPDNATADQETIVSGLTRILFMTTNTTTRSDLMKVIRKLETSPIVFRVLPVDYTPVQTCASVVPDGLVVGYTLDATCALYTLQNVVGKIEFSDKQRCFGDMDKDGEITSNDALMILQTTVGKIEKRYKAQTQWTFMMLNSVKPEVMYG